jgi:hypothetical protein
MAKNRLSKFIKEETEHFIAKFYLLSEIETDDHSACYQLFYKSNGKGRWNPRCEEYSGLQYIVLNSVEIQHFREVYEDKYKTEVHNEHGRIYILKEVGFDKTGIIPN